MFVKFIAVDAKWTAQSNTLLSIGEQQVAAAAAAPCEFTAPPKEATEAAAAAAIANQKLVQQFPRPNNKISNQLLCVFLVCAPASEMIN